MLNKIVVRIGQLGKRIGGDRWRPLVRRFYEGSSYVYDRATRFLLPDYQSSVARLLERLNVANHDRVQYALKPGKRFVVLDANLFEGVWGLLNPIIAPIGERMTGWDASKDLIGDLGRVFGQVDVRKFNGGSLFLAVATKV
jgi:hypothetical protein